MTETVAPENTEAPAADAATAQQERLEKAYALVRSYTPWSAGAGIVPFPALDILAFEAVQLRMISKLSELYGVPFRNDAVKSIVSVLISTSYASVTGGALASVVKFIPFVGPLASLTMVPGTFAAATWAMGRVFIAHFESGGTLLNFNVGNMKTAFSEEYALARGKNATAAPPAAEPAAAEPTPKAA